jgi:hypothetical protein
MLPGVSLKEPAGHGVHGSLPVSLKDPGSQRTAAAGEARRPEATMTAVRMAVRMARESRTRVHAHQVFLWKVVVSSRDEPTTRGRGGVLARTSLLAN